MNNFQQSPFFKGFRLARNRKNGKAWLRVVAPAMLSAAIIGGALGYRQFFEVDERAPVARETDPGLMAGTGSRPLATPAIAPVALPSTGYGTAAQR